MRQSWSNLFFWIKGNSLMRLFDVWNAFFMPPLINFSIELSKKICHLKKIRGNSNLEISIWSWLVFAKIWSMYSWNMEPFMIYVWVSSSGKPNDMHRTGLYLYSTCRYLVKWALTVGQWVVSGGARITFSGWYNDLLKGCTKESKKSKN